MACLASAARHFGRPDNEPNTHLRVVRGVFAFLNYASKHWTEYILSYAETCSRSGVYDTQFLEATERLANSLYELVPVPNAILTNSQSLGPRLEALQNFPSIRPYVKMALKFQSQEAIDKVFVENGKEGSTQAGPFIDAVSMLLKKYRDAVRWLLRQDYYPGVSRDDFELFRAQTQTSLFTCLLPLCPSASIGYETEVELREHELEHTKGFPCRVGGCQYPPFRSAQLLENHFKKHHHQDPPKRNLRRVGEFRYKPGGVRVDSARIAPGTAASNKTATSLSAGPITGGGQVQSPHLRRQSPSTTTQGTAGTSLIQMADASGDEPPPYRQVHTSIEEDDEGIGMSLPPLVRWNFASLETPVGDEGFPLTLEIGEEYDEEPRDATAVVEAPSFPSFPLPSNLERAARKVVVDENYDTEEEEEKVEDDEQEESESSELKSSNSIQDSRGMMRSRGSVPQNASRWRKNRRDYPSSWAFDKSQLTMKERVLAVFEGPRRLAKNDMMLSTEHEVRIKLSDNKSWVTDSDVQTLKSAERFRDAMDEKGPWISDNPTEDELKQMREMLENGKK